MSVNPPPPPPALTTTVAVPVLPDAVWVAVIVAVPAATAVTTPAASTVATAVSDDRKVEPAVSGPVVALLYDAVTVSARVPPGARMLDAGLTVIESTRSGETETVVVAVLPDSACVAVMVALPAATAVTYPVSRPTVATAGAEDTNVVPKLTTKVESSEKVPVTVSDRTPPISMLTGFGVTAMDDTVATLGESGSEG